MDREKAIKEFEHLLNAAKGNYQDFVDLTVDGGEEILAFLKEQEAVKIEVKKINNSGRCGRCPNCLMELNEMDYPNYCGYCGQKVKYGNG